MNEEKEWLTHGLTTRTGAQGAGDSRGEEEDFEESCWPIGIR